MKDFLLNELTQEATATALQWTPREAALLEEFISNVQAKLNGVIASSKQEHALNALHFELMQKGEYSQNEENYQVQIEITIFNSECKIILPSKLALEMVNSYLVKEPPVVERALNKEEISVIALVTTLVVSELRLGGILGIYLRSVRQLEDSLELNANQLSFLERTYRQKILVELDPTLLGQFSQVSKLTLVGSRIEELIHLTNHRVNLTINAEVRSLTALLKLKPGMKWKLGENVWPTVSLGGQTIGCGNLSIRSI